ncbi:MAG: alpha/beta hydrolase family protein [Planctomycetota bacterium]|jgi:dienelactone hydrolase
MNNLNSSYTEEDVEINCNGVTLRGIVTLPEKSFSRAVITVHGWAGNRAGPQRMFVILAGKLAEKGLAVLRFDLQGRGYSDPISQETSLDEMISNVKSAADYLANKYQANKIDLVGICSGGNVALGALPLLAEMAGKTAGISVLPFQPPSHEMRFQKTADFLKKYFLKLFSLKTWQRIFKGDINYSGVGKTLQDSMLGDNEKELQLKTSSRDIISELKAFEKEIYLIYGENDPQAEGAEKSFKDDLLSSRANLKTKIIEKADHNFYSASAMEKLIAEIIQYLGD